MFVGLCAELFEFFDDLVSEFGKLGFSEVT